MKISPPHLAAGVGVLLAGVGISQARDSGQYSQSPQEIKTWIEHLTNNLGNLCCDDADGFAPDVWDIGPKSYRVKIHEEWLIVPDVAVIKGPNRLGHAVVWLEPTWALGESSDMVRCFLPGPQS